MHLPLYVKQFIACARSLFEIPTSWKPLITNFSQQELQEIERWYREFYSDIQSSKNGYPLGQVRRTPDLEDRLVNICRNSTILGNFPEKTSEPMLCLTHDIDYLAPTLPMKLKRSINKKKFNFNLNLNKENYLFSIEELLRLDSEITGVNAVSTVFLASKVWVSPLTKRLIQWLIDPSYNHKDPLFKELLDIIQKYQCNIGLHSGFFSLECKTISKELNILSKSINCNIVAGRQHWLNLPVQESLERIREAGIVIDSTLGWNGTVGFRGGMARPYLIELSTGALWEVPMLIMDGAMFDDMRLDTQEVFDLAKKLLTEVYERRGCVAINWHDRAAHPEYGWIDAYAKILTWAREKGFRFCSIQDSIKDKNYAVSI